MRRSFWEMRFDQKHERLCQNCLGLPRPVVGADRSISLNDLQRALWVFLSFSRSSLQVAQAVPSNMSDLIHVLFCWCISITPGMSCS